MKLMFSLVMAAGLLAMPAVAADSSAFFNGKELSLSVGSSYVVDAHADTVKAAFAKPYALNVNAGANYFFNKYVGIEAEVPFYSTKGVSVSEVETGIKLRLPIAFVAPYVAVDGVYNWVNTADARWAYVAKAGLEVRPNSKWGAFIEGNYRNNKFDDKGVVGVAGGLRLVLF